MYEQIPIQILNSRSKQYFFCPFRPSEPYSFQINSSGGEYLFRLKIVFPNTVLFSISELNNLSSGAIHLYPITSLFHYDLDQLDILPKSPSG